MFYTLGFGSHFTRRSPHTLVLSLLEAYCAISLCASISNPGIHWSAVAHFLLQLHFLFQICNGWFTNINYVLIETNKRATLRVSIAKTPPKHTMKKVLVLAFRWSKMLTLLMHLCSTFGLVLFELNDVHASIITFVTCWQQDHSHGLFWMYIVLLRIPFYFKVAHVNTETDRYIS